LDTNKPSLTQSVDERLFRLLVASVKDYAIFLIDPNGYILSWNEGAQNIKGYRAEEVIGKHISMFYLKDETERKQLRENLNQALKKGVYESEGWRVKKNGTIFWAHMVLTTLYNDQGHLIGFAKVTRDITERKEAEDRKARINVELEKRVKENTEQIIANELRFRKLIENSYEGISLLDKDLKTFYRSPSSERINGWGYDDRSESNAMDIVHPDDLPLVSEQFKELLQKTAQNFVITCRIKHKQGHYIWVECVFNNMLHDANINAIVCNLRDITEQRNAQLERDKITTDLVQRNKDLEQFAYIVSHNLRVPVANITGLTELLKDEDVNDDDRKKTLKALAASVKNLDEVLLDLNHILQVSSEINDQIEPVSLTLLIKEIKVGISYMLQSKQAIVNYDFKAVDILLSLKSYLHSIFQNLIINSIKYRQKDVNPVINISSEVDNDYITLKVKDNGKGIDLSRNGCHIFGLYKRFDRSVEGKGIGLFMVKMQVERLGGSIAVTSELNKGTEFIIKFPVALKHE
jgi:PAS domain S-box-containing protein